MEATFNVKESQNLTTTAQEDIFSVDFGTGEGRTIVNNTEVLYECILLCPFFRQIGIDLEGNEKKFKFRQIVSLHKFY